ncbi:hypothetical protein HK104_005467 [Borealophlyctis nickersoniae]|nr:hypothetical protein HK104_005467 [Borealophlyctis nickersoniae]
MPRITELPDIPLITITSFLSAISLAKWGATCSLLRNFATDERVWKEHALTDWPWFFWTGSCERTLSALIPSPSPSSKWKSTLESRPDDLRDLGALRDGDLGETCLANHQPFRNPYHPLPKSYRTAYALIAGGKYVGLLNVLSSLRDRQMSAFTAVAQYDPPSRQFLLAYRPEATGRYRLGKYVDLRGEYSDLVDERLPVSQRHRFRRIPEDLLDWDTRELYARELFGTALENGRPSFLPGEEVEVQWKFRLSGEWAWWRGIVGSVRGGGWAGDNDDDDGGDDQVPFGILVVFPHYPPGSIWDSVVASCNGLMELNPPGSGSLGYVGGVKRVKCLAHRALWKRNYEVVTFHQQPQQPQPQQQLAVQQPHGVIILPATAEENAPDDEENDEVDAN